MRHQSESRANRTCHYRLTNPLLILFGLFLIATGILIGNRLQAMHPPQDPALLPFYQQMSDSGNNRKQIEKGLKDNCSLYRIDNNLLADAIGNLCPAIFEGEAISYQDRLENCLYRRLVKQSKVNSINWDASWQDVIYELRVSVPPKKYQPADNIAYTCFAGKFIDRVLRLKSHNGQAPLELHVVGGYSCTEGRRYPDLQLNERQANHLFKRKLLQSENVSAVIL